VTAVC